MKYESPPRLSREEITRILLQFPLPNELRNKALLSAVYFHGPQFSLETLISAFSRAPVEAKIGMSQFFITHYDLYGGVDRIDEIIDLLRDSRDLCHKPCGFDAALEEVLEIREQRQ